MRAAIRVLTQPVLADQHERGKKDRLERNDHRQEPVREGIERFEAEMSRVYQNPDAEPDDVEIDEGHTAGECRDRIGDVLLKAALFSGLDVEAGERANVVLDGIGESR